MSNTATVRRPEVDEDWEDLVSEYQVRPDTIYLNHGSFGIAPRPVREARREWIDKLDGQPMDFFVRELEPLMAAALERLGIFLNTDSTNLVFAENATSAMNVVANSLELKPGDHVLTNNHEYGAVQRIWQRACDAAGAGHGTVRLPEVFESHEQVVDAIFSAVTDETRLIVISHITSPTALILPVTEICRRASQLNIPVCIDGPHAPAHVPLDLTDIGCAFYTASCHKWLSATLGSGFLFVHPDFHHCVETPMKSWGRLLPAVPEKWFEEFIWSGTRDPSAYFSITAAIDFLESVGAEAFRARTRHMQRETTRQLMDLTGKQPIGRDVDLWYGTMAHVPLPDGDWSELQKNLWEQSRIEVPVINFEDRWYIRVSHHLYNTRQQYNVLMESLQNAFAR